MSDFRDRLRALPVFPDDLTVFDLAALPVDPLDLVRDWLADAIASGERAPHAAAFVTVDDHGRPATRSLTVKDVDDRGVHVASRRSSRKGRQLAANPSSSVFFYWRELARQLELVGTATPLSAEESLADWRARPTYAGTDDPDWQVWAVRPDRVEFLQATHDRNHRRALYVRTPDGWEVTTSGD
ncbi:MAG: pyridoxamine 5'-phosphate oxidase family protein [Gordonia sp. (in: high G+C Gram-positive bacteria)]|uniref:pyridoxine/pyridoxamine 5'-phosphate oxidase n=1 Tax=Gordonia sp. (in: high G+C Gram-positive bacteria) TaxID=84139 RepID=UPI0039E6C2A3